MAGITDTGFTIRDLETILTAIESDQLANIDSELNLEADGVLGQLNGIFAAQIHELWELAEAVYQAAYPDTATGVALSYIGALTGTIRNPALKATANMSCTFSGTPTLPAGTTVYVTATPTSRWEIADAVDLTVSPQVVAFTAVTAGLATTISNGDPLTIDTPVTDWTAVSYVADSIVPGVDEETDAALRSRREDELARPGTGTVDAIRADILANADINAISCSVFENASGVIDANGLPPHSIECLVGDDAVDLIDATELAQQIWDSKPAGTETYGSSSGTATDDAGTSQTMYYSEPTDIRTYMDFTFTYDGDIYASDAAAVTAVEAVLVTWALANLTLGVSIYHSMIIEQVMQVNGVVNIVPSSVEVDDQASPTSTDPLTITGRQISTVASADMTLVASEAV